jgi:tetratricopeptide (TPR) repeat protein
MKIYSKVLFPLLLLLITSGCVSDKISMYGRFVGVYEKYDETIHSLTKYLGSEKSLAPQEKAAYLLLIGIAYQKKLALKQSMEYYDQSLDASHEFNYFALLQKADIYRLENNYDNEMEYLKLAVKDIQILLSKIKSNSLSETEIEWDKKLEFVISYYINKENIEAVKQSYSTILENKIIKIENIIKSRVENKSPR